MNCYLHSEVPAVAFCRSCGRPMCAACQRPANGTLYCQEHVPVLDPNITPGASTPGAANAQNPYAQPVGAPIPPMAVNTSPGLAFALGFIPGVGAIYNGQYLKGLVHAIIFGLLISLMNALDHSAGEPLLAICLTAFVFYMPFEAFHTAKRRLLGIPVEEFSSLIAQNRLSSRTPIGPIFLIAIGVLFLLDTLNLVHFHDLARFWPVLLILVGAFMLYNRVSGPVVSAAGVDPARESVSGEYAEPHQ